METSIHPPTRLRTRLTVETLEGRAMPAALISQPLGIQSALVSPGSSSVAMPVISRIFVNGELVMRVEGKPTFAAIGPAASGNQNGQTETGGTTLFVNGQAVGTFQNSPLIVRTVTIVTNRHGELVEVFSYHITGIPYVPPPADAGIDADAIGGAWVG